MALGTPSIGTSSLYYSEYETDFINLLQRLADNASNDIDAKDVRDTVWTLYNQIQTVASQSLTQSFSYTLGTPSTIGVGGISAGSTFSNISFQDFLDTLLLPYVAPQITGLTPSSLELEFGDTTPVNLTYTIDVGSSPISGNLTFTSPTGLFSTVASSGSDPETGTTPNNFTPTYSTTVTLIGQNVATMSFSTTDSLTFSATTSVIFKHKKYWGPLDLTSIGGFTSSSTASISSVSTFIDDTKILSLSYSVLSTDFEFSSEMYFATGSYFVFACPTIFGTLSQDGFYVNNLFSSGFTRIRNGITFSNIHSYDVLFDVWVSDYSYDDVTIKINAN